MEPDEPPTIDEAPEDMRNLQDAEISMEEHARRANKEYEFKMRLISENPKKFLAENE